MVMAGEKKHSLIMIINSIINSECIKLSPNGRHSNILFNSI
jgi:hypothetical protein